MDEKSHAELCDEIIAALYVIGELVCANDGAIQAELELLGNFSNNQVKHAMGGLITRGLVVKHRDGIMSLYDGVDTERPCHYGLTDAGKRRASELILEAIMEEEGPFDRFELVQVVCWLAMARKKRVAPGLRALRERSGLLSVPLDNFRAALGHCADAGMIRMRTLDSGAIVIRWTGKF